MLLASGIALAILAIIGFTKKYQSNTQPKAAQLTTAAPQPADSTTADQKKAETTSPQINGEPTISRNTFRILNNPSRFIAYINTEFFKDADLGKNIRGGFMLANYDEQQQGGYRSALHMLMVSCNENKAVQVKVWFAAGLNMTEKIVGHARGESVLSPTAESVLGLIRRTLCYPQQMAETVLSDIAQQSGSGYPPTIIIDISQFNWTNDTFDFNKVTPREAALAAMMELNQRVLDFARSTKPVCQYAASGLQSIVRSATEQFEIADNVVQQGGASDIYESPRSIANAGLGQAKAMDACP